MNRDRTLEDFQGLHIPNGRGSDRWSALCLVCKMKYEEEVSKESRSVKGERVTNVQTDPVDVLPPKPDAPTVASPPPELLDEFKKRIEAVGGTEVGMIIEKLLTATDMQRNHGRLSIPFGQLGNGFLREEESDYLANQSVMEVRLLEPSQEVGKINLRQWDMGKRSGKITSMYVLRTQWNAVVAKNDLGAGDLIQLWSFRMGEKEELGLALVVVRRGGRVGGKGIKGSDSKGGSLRKRKKLP